MRFTVLAIALLLSSCGARPAPLRTSDEIQQLIRLADQALRLVQKIEGHASADDIQADLRQMIAAVTAIKAPYLEAKNIGGPTTVRGIDARAAGEVTSCAVTAAREFLSTENMRSILLVQVAMDTAQCASLATAYLNVIRDDDIADNVGFAIAVVYPVALAIRAKAGLQTDALLDSYQTANAALVAKLAPKCHKAWVPNLSEWAIDVYYECVAYNGVRARGKNRESAIAEATRLTSGAVATAVLAKWVPAGSAG